MKPIKTMCNKVETEMSFAVWGTDYMPMVDVKRQYSKNEMWLEKIFIEDKRKNLPELCNIGNAIWKGSMVLVREKKLSILRTESAMCGVKIMNSKNTNKLMDMLGFNKMAKTNGVRWYGYV